MNSNSTTAAVAAFDVEVLRKKYEVERLRRLRSDGNNQYVEVSGNFAHFVDDPYVDANFTRDAVTEDVGVLIIGGGFSGLSVAARLRIRGVPDIRIIERGGDFGGTWYWNRYPGAQCDIESYLYLPLLEETGYMPKEKYSYRPEIFAYAQQIGRHFDLYKDAMFQTEVTALSWLEGEGKWDVKTNRGDCFKAHFVVQTNGPLDRPKLPGIPGIETFSGKMFHTSRWDYDYTGGDSSGDLHKLADKRVAIIGTGATGVQSVPYVGRYAKQLYVVQRTPSSVDERRNGPTDTNWAASLTPGWQARRRHNFVTLTSGGRAEEDLVGDGWTDAVRKLGSLVGHDSDDQSTAQDDVLAKEIADFTKMNEIRDRIDAVVNDTATAEALKPWYRQFCKRPTFNDDYLPTFNRDNVKLLDTNGRGPDAISEEGLVIGGVAYSVDCIIFATGFEIGTGYARRAGHDTIGRGGKSLSAEWEKGYRTLHGFYTHDFPNLFHTGISQNGVSFALTYCLDEQAEHIADVLGKATAEGVQLIEPTSEAEARWGDVIGSKAGKLLEFQRSCTPGFYNNEGKVGEVKRVQDETYGDGPIKFYELIRKWRQDGYEGLTFE